MLYVYHRELTPIEEASRLNQKLKANYEARLARLTPGQATQKTSLVSLGGGECAYLCLLSEINELVHTYMHI